MAQVIQLRKVLAVRRREQQHAAAVQCVEILEHSLRRQVEAFAHAPPREWPVRATKIRKLGELLEYSTQMGELRTSL